MAKNDVNAAIVSLKELLSGDDDFVREAVRGYLQDVLEEEMTAEEDRPLDGCRDRRALREDRVQKVHDGAEREEGAKSLRLTEH